MSNADQRKTFCPSPFPATIRRVGVFCPAGSPPSDRLEKGCRQLQAWGLDTCLAGVPSPSDRYLAATDAQRVHAFHELLANDDVDVVVAARGGYGCARLLDLIDWKLWHGTQKPVIAEVPFGHRFPSISFPVGRQAELRACAEEVQVSWS